jgi:hypothetical protein
MNVVRAGQSTTLELKNKNIKGINFLFRMTHTTDNTAFANNTRYDLKKVDVSIRKISGGSKKEVLIYSGKLAPLAISTTLEDNAFRFSFPETGASQIFVERAHGASTKAIAVQPIYVDFGTVINLDGNDQLIIDCTLDSAAHSSSIDPATSYLQIEAKEGIGLEYYTPVFKALAVPGSQNNFEVSLGDGVQDITFINLDKQSNIAANDVVRKVTIVSDKLNQVDDATELRAKRFSRMLPTEAAARFQNHLLFNSSFDLNNCNLKLDLEETNVTTGENWVVVKYLHKDGQVFAKAQAKERKFTGINLSRLMR